MLKLLLAGVMMLAVNPALPPNSTPYSSSAPPMRYRGDNAPGTLFVSDVAPYCGPSDPGHRIIACSGDKNGTPIIVLPNPCPLADVEVYARIACHELGHRNGWPPLHGD